MTDIVVVGSGVMGRAIAGSFAKAGLSVAILTRDRASITAPGDDVRVVDRIEGLSPRMVIEAVPEDLALKQRLFRAIEPMVGVECVIASNTSGLPIEELAEAFERPERFMGIHYFFPADIVPAVEIVWGTATTREASNIARELLRQSGRAAVVVEKPVIGAVVNRLQHAILHEAYDLMSRGLVDAHALDLAAQYILGPRMCISGLLKQKDLGGLEGHIRAQQAIVPDLCHDPKPNPVVQQMLADGHLGIRTGRGFYDWAHRDSEAEAAAAADNLKELVAWLKGIERAHDEH